MSNEVTDTTAEAALDCDLQAAFEARLRSRAFRQELIELLDADSELEQRTKIVAEQLKATAMGVFTRSH